MEIIINSYSQLTIVNVDMNYHYLYTFRDVTAELRKDSDSETHTIVRYNVKIPCQIFA